MTSFHPAFDLNRSSFSPNAADAAGFRVSDVHGGSGAAGPLGTVAKSSPPSGHSDGFDIHSSHRSVRSKRFHLLAEARNLLLREGRRQKLRWWHKVHRTAGCKYIKNIAEGSAAIKHDPIHGKSFFVGIQTCGSVWACPVCSAKIQERRREEIAQGMDWAYGRGLKAVMVTLTFPHRKYHRLEDLLKKQADALARLRKGKTWDTVKEITGFEGLIRSLELTYGDHGWHPHSHELWFIDKNADANQLKNKVIKKWRLACSAAGLLDEGDRGFDNYSVDIKDNASNSDYLAKQDSSRNWGADREIAKATSKTGNKSKGRHPFALLEQSANGDEKSGRLFLEYALHMQGKRQLFWSHGLKKRVGIVDKKDEQVAEESKEEAIPVGQLTDEEWDLVRKDNAQADVLNASETGGWPLVKRILGKLEKEKESADSGCDPNRRVHTRLPDKTTGVNDEEVYQRTAGSVKELPPGG